MQPFPAAPAAPGGALVCNGGGRSDGVRDGGAGDVGRGPHPHAVAGSARPCAGAWAAGPFSAAGRAAASIGHVTPVRRSWGRPARPSGGRAPARGRRHGSGSPDDQVVAACGRAGPVPGRDPGAGYLCGPTVVRQPGGGRWPEAAAGAPRRSPPPRRRTVRRPACGRRTAPRSRRTVTRRLMRALRVRAAMAGSTARQAPAGCRKDAVVSWLGQERARSSVRGAFREGAGGACPGFRRAKQPSARTAGAGDRPRTWPRAGPGHLRNRP